VVIFRCQKGSASKKVWETLVYMLLLSEQQSVKVWEPSNKECAFGNRNPLDTRVISLSSIMVKLKLVSIFVYPYAGETCLRGKPYRPKYFFPSFLDMLGNTAQLSPTRYIHTYVRTLLCLLGSLRLLFFHLPTHPPTYTPTPSLTQSMAQF
jgi:hypothetical protein